jgi:hypothetical protein
MLSDKKVPAVRDWRANLTDEEQDWLKDDMMANDAEYEGATR